MSSSSEVLYRLVSMDEHNIMNYHCRCA